MTHHETITLSAAVAAGLAIASLTAVIALNAARLDGYRLAIRHVNAGLGTQSGRRAAPPDRKNE